MCLLLYMTHHRKLMKRKRTSSYIKATVNEEDPKTPPIIIINTQSPGEAVSLLCALGGEILQSYSNGDKAVARRMGKDIIRILDMLYGNIIDSMEE